MSGLTTRQGTTSARERATAIPGEPGSGTVQLNGAAARLVDVGDIVIVMAYVELEQSEVPGWQPRVVLVDPSNRITEVRVGVETPRLAELSG